ncbi:hypothetical protein [Streptomyces alboniger]|uniref:Uncharacterized protein n=1 Tax=Streptomyces alboniger TaxID=132473 RepID=A0A5J6HNU7_STRAD|nr:hypothetical protein [Streptomyces alboniger]QEV18817.1 hypothetical protein CP975_16160 [Streptomyces alboniger]
MRTRKAIAGLALGTTVGLGLMAAPAQAAPAQVAPAQAAQSVEETKGAQATRHFYSSHWTLRECQARGNYWMSRNPSWGAECDPGLGTDGRFKYHLYMWY